MLWAVLRLTFSVKINLKIALEVQNWNTLELEHTGIKLSHKPS